MKKLTLIKIKKYIKLSKTLYTKILEDDIFALAAQLSYNLILAFFPFLIFLLTLIGFSSLDSNSVLELLKPVIPHSSYYLIKEIVVEVVDVQRSGLLWFSIGLSIWTAASGFSAVINGLNKAYSVKDKRSFIKIRIISIICTFILAILIILTLFLLVFGDLIGQYLLNTFHFDLAIHFIWNVLRIIIIISMMVITFVALYNYTPSKRLGWRKVLPGAITTTIGWIISSYAFAFYVNNFSNYSRLYGSLGAVVVLMTWIFITSLILIVGGEINAVLANKN
ncbi:membrane protein [Clostridium cavendishii DSM 21758]|uniref:Membrane protein n=1 Tax=Clostridium cavendishii DSM 21758 TaxID=1121302 RepID=A0A1M6TSV9_9CLOT|nr:YihY/virulence factor BrkB family protein [Clostridium cavendishii]SHK59990.1 membrane protein [Clostridium cavendishii DSM 21758]